MQLDYRFAVLGDPIAHSKSPIIHQQFADQSALTIRYEKIHVTQENFSAEVDRLEAEGYRGINITVPHKSAAFQYVDALGTLNKQACRATAINTIKFSQPIQGINTDGPGLVQDIKKRLSITLQHANILVIGAGGASWGIMGSLLAEQPNQIGIVNRTEAKAFGLAKAFDVNGLQWSKLSSYKPDIIINATASGLRNTALELPNCLLDSAKLAYDLMYADTKTPFELWAQQSKSAQVNNGSGMLIEQAALAFSWWTGKSVDTSIVKF